MPSHDNANHRILLSSANTAVYTDNMSADEDLILKDNLKPLNMRTGRRRHAIWRNFNRYERKYYKRGEEENVINKRTIAICIKCQHSSSTNLDTLANHVLFGGDEWSTSVRTIAQQIINKKTGRQSKKRRLEESSQENANSNLIEVCIC